MPDPVIVYIDTNVWLDAIETSRRNQHSILLLDRIRSDPRCVAVTSTYAIMEAEEQLQEIALEKAILSSGYSPREMRTMIHRWPLPKVDRHACGRRAQDALRSLRHKVSIKSPGEPETWRLAASLVQSAGLSAPDAIHVAVALACGAHGIASGDALMLERVRASAALRRRLVPIPTTGGENTRKFQSVLTRAIRTMETRRRPPQPSLPSASPPSSLSTVGNVLHWIKGAGSSATTGAAMVPLNQAPSPSARAHLTSRDASQGGVP